MLDSTVEGAWLERAGVGGCCTHPGSHTKAGLVPPRVEPLPGDQAGTRPL